MNISQSAQEGPHVFRYLELVEVPVKVLSVSQALVCMTQRTLKSSD
jgi:hypothetical protein